MIENEFLTDLEPELWKGDEVTEEIIAAGKRMGDLDLLPSPFPIEDLLGERELRHVKRLYGIGGLSYGNLSQRKDEQRFWMSACGVDKSELEIPGRDILLVSNYDQEHGQDRAQRPARRRAAPRLGRRDRALDDLPGAPRRRRDPPRPRVDGGHRRDRRQLPLRHRGAGDQRRRALAQEPEPDDAVIGLRNHGITVTGPSLMEILDRIEPKILRQIPML